MLLTVFVGLPQLKIHAQSAETEAAEPVGQPGSEDAATQGEPAGEAAEDAKGCKPVGEPVTEADADAALKPTRQSPEAKTEAEMRKKKRHRGMKPPHPNGPRLS